MTKSERIAELQTEMHRLRKAHMVEDDPEIRSLMIELIGKIAERVQALKKEAAA
jgi:hypothetical protein